MGRDSWSQPVVRGVFRLRGRAALVALPVCVAVLLSQPGIAQAQGGSQAKATTAAQGKPHLFDPRSAATSTNHLPTTSSKPFKVNTAAFSQPHQTPPVTMQPALLDLDPERSTQ